MSKTMNALETARADYRRFRASSRLPNTEFDRRAADVVKTLAVGREPTPRDWANAALHVTDLASRGHYAQARAGLEYVTSIKSW